MCTSRTRSGCDEAGDKLFCQLCPASPTYWADQPRTPSPPDARPDGLPLVVEKQRKPVLDWSRNGPDGPGSFSSFPQPCRSCKKPTRLLSPRGIPSHKVCAERYLADHPQTPPVTPGALQ